MNNPEDQNPMLPNLRDESIERMMRLVFLWFFGLAIATLLVIAFLFLNSVHKKNLERFNPFDPPIDRSGRTNVFYVLGRTYRSFGVETDWTNVVFSSTREPVVTKPNGEWRIQFK